MKNIFYKALLLLEMSIDIRQKYNPKEIEELIKQYKKTKDTNIRNEIIENFYGMVQKYANKYAFNYGDKDDLFQLGILTISKAIDNYKAGSGKFLGFLSKYLQGEMKKFYNTDKYKRHATTRLDVNIGGSSGKKSDDSSRTFGDIIPDANDFIETLMRSDEIKALNKALSKLKDKEAEIIRMYYGIGDLNKHKIKSKKERYTFEEIGKILGMTKMGAKKAFDKSMEKLKKELRKVA